jgi:hypothetical protein
MARTRKMSLEEQLAHRGFESASVARTLHNGAMEVHANVLHPLPIGGQDPVYAPIPVSLTVAPDKKSGIHIVAGGVPTEKSIADATRFVQMLRDNGHVTDESEKDFGASGCRARPAPGVTHQIRRDEKGRRVLQRIRFSAA